ncbi:hypothetical protein BH10ACT11_BH10ACT11_10160 [soil metagenome]
MSRMRELAERAETWLYTGPLGRVFAFVGDFFGAWLRWARGLDPSTRPERRPPDAKRSGSRRKPKS